MKNSSRVPSLKSSLNIVSIANKEDNSAAIHITPGAKDLKKSWSGLNAKGKKLITIKKKINGVIYVEDLLKAINKSLFRIKKNQSEILDCMI